MRIWFDTEFMEDGKTIELLSIGLVREDDAMLYMENADADHSKANDWVKANVLPKMSCAGAEKWVGHEEMVPHLLEFCGEDPQFYAYFGAYDWVALCQIFGTMMELPRHWPMRFVEVAEFAQRANVVPPGNANEHHALGDALWARELWRLARERIAT